MSGDCVPVARVGHVRSPRLKEMFPSSGIGWTKYSLYIYMMKANADQVSKLAGTQEYYDSVYRAILSSEMVKELFAEALSFFMAEHIMFDQSHQIFLTYTDADTDSGVALAGIINEENFDEVRAAVLLLNYISPAKANVDVQFSSERAKELWERAQKYLAQQEPKESDPAMAMGNIISKLCVIHPSYNYLNVYDLTVFQLYDAFFQLCYMRSVAFSEAVVSNHGSKEFKFSDWMNPVKNYT